MELAFLGLGRAVVALAVALAVALVAAEAVAAVAAAPSTSASRTRRPSSWTAFNTRRLPCQSTTSSATFTQVRSNLNQTVLVAAAALRSSLYHRLDRMLLLSRKSVCLHPFTSSRLVCRPPADHYGGLNKHFDAGTIYCSSITAALVHSRLGVPRRFLRVLPMDTPVSVAGVTVTLLSANHCPGAVMFLFDCPPPMGVGRHHRYLHVGDFRWHRSMMKWPLLRGVAMSALADAAGGSVPSGFSIGGLSAGASLFGGAGAGITAVAPVLSDAAAGADAAPKLTPPKGRLDALYLDTTYCEPSHAFPPQEACVAAVRQTALAFASDPGVLLLFGAYTIGKERVFMEVARALNERIYVDATRYRTLSLLEWPLEDRARLTSDPSAARIHVVPMGYLSLGRLHERLRGIREAAEAALAARIDVAFAAVAGAGTTPAAAVPLAAGRPALAPVSAAANARPVATSAARPTATATPKPFPGAPPDDASAGPNVFIAGVAATPHPQDAPEPVLGSALGIALPSTVRDFTGARRSLGFNKFVGLKKGATGTSTGVFAVPTPAGLPTTSAGMIGSISAAADTAVIAVEEDEVEPSITGVGSKRMAPVPGRGRGRGRGRGKAIGAGYFERIAQLGAAQAHAHATGASTDEGVEDADFGADLAAGSDGGILSVFAPAPAAARAHAAGNASGASPGHGASNGHAAHAASRGSALGLRPVPARQFTGHHDDDGFDGGQDDFDDNDNDDDDGDFGGAGFLPEDAEAVAWSQDVAQLGSSSSSGGVSFGVGAVRAAGGASSSSGNAGTGAIAPHSRTTPAQLLPQASFRVSGAGALGQVAASASAPASAASSSLHSSSAAPLPPPSRKYGPFHSIVAFKPTGWAYAPAAAGKPTHGASATGSSSGSGSGHWQGHGQGQGQSQPGDTFQLVDIAARITADSLEAEARREWEERQRQRDRQRQQAGIAGPGAGLGASGASGGTGAALSFNAMDRREGADDLDLPGAGASGLRASGAAGAALDASPVAIDDIVDARRPAAVAQRVFVDDAAALPLPNGASAPLRSSAAGPSVAGTAGGHGSGNAGPASTSAAAAPPSLAGIASSSASAPAGLALASRVVTVRMTKQTRAGGARIHPGGALAPAPAQAPAQAQAPAVPSHAAGSATPASGSRPGVAPVPAAGPGLSARGPVPEPPSPAICMLARQLCVPVAALQAFMLAPAAPPAAPRSAPGGQGGQRTGAAATAAAALPAGTPSGSAPSSTTATATAPAAAAESARRRKLPPGGVTLFSVPYSEHSSFDELRECVAFLDPVAIVPTVNCRSAADAARIVRMMRATDPAAAAAGDDV